MRPIAFAVLIVQVLAVMASAQDAQEAKGPPTLADLLPDETREGVDQAIDDLHPSVKEILSRAASRVAKNNRETNEANDAVIAEEKKNLEQEFDHLTKDGKLEQAVATKKLLGAFDEAVMQSVEARLPRGRVERGPSPIGKWDWGGHAGGWILLKPDGTAVSSWHRNPCVWGRGDDGRIRLIVTNKRLLTVGTLSPDGQTMDATILDQSNSKNETVTLRRSK